MELNIEIPSPDTYPEGYHEPNDEWCLIDFPYTRTAVNENRRNVINQITERMSSVATVGDILRYNGTEWVHDRPRLRNRWRIRRGGYRDRYSDTVKQLLGEREQLAKIREFMKETPAVVMDVALELMRDDRFDATLKSVELADEWLTKDEIEHLINEGYIDIQSKKYEDRIYRVLADPSQRVQVFYKHRSIGTACGIVSDYVADPSSENFEGSFVVIDHLMAKIIALKTDEDYFLSKANVSPGLRR